MQHLTSLVTLLGHQLVAYGEQPREAGLDDLVEVGSVVTLVGLETICPADGQEALEAGQDRGGIVGVEELDGEVQEARPSLREVITQDSLYYRDKLVADAGL